MSKQKALQMVLGIAGAMPAKPVRKRDARDALWESALRWASVRASAGELMKIGCWLHFSRGVPVEVVNEALGYVGRAISPWAYLQTGGKAIEALVANVALARAEREKAANFKADADFFGTSSRPEPDPRQ